MPTRPDLSTLGRRERSSRLRRRPQPYPVAQQNQQNEPEPLALPPPNQIALVDPPQNGVVSINLDHQRFEPINMSHVERRIIQNGHNLALTLFAPEKCKTTTEICGAQWENLYIASQAMMQYRPTNRGAFMVNI